MHISSIIFLFWIPVRSRGWRTMTEISAYEPTLNNNTLQPWPRNIFAHEFRTRVCPFCNKDAKNRWCSNHHIKTIHRIMAVMRMYKFEYQPHQSVNSKKIFPKEKDFKRKSHFFYLGYNRTYTEKRGDVITSVFPHT